MADSNEIVQKQADHPRLRLPQAGIKAQKEYDEGKPLTSKSMTSRMNETMLDLMNDRIGTDKAFAIVAVANSISKVMQLEMKHREIYYKYLCQKGRDLEPPDPLQIAVGKTLLGKP